MAENYDFVGWVAHDPSSAGKHSDPRVIISVLMNNKDGKMKWEKFDPKPFEEDDVDIKVECCGICGSDLHVLRSGWFPTPYRESRRFSRSETTAEQFDAQLL